jgi:GT2 family glycosyltransferase/glycosyltransferase involved in cell wall biosynthesis
MASDNPVQDQIAHTALGKALTGLFDADWYRTRYPDIEASGADPLAHFVAHGAAEGRDPNRWFDSAWYARQNPDVSEQGMVPLLHYLQHGAAELRDPHPHFDAAWYVSQHPEAGANPLLYHLWVGLARGWPTEKQIAIEDYLPAPDVAPRLPRRLAVDVIVPVYRGVAATQLCLESVLADTGRPDGRIIVVDDNSPEPEIRNWLDSLAAEGRITLVRNSRNMGFVASANRGMVTAGDHDVVLLNSDTEVPPGWLRRLAAHAYSAPRIASVSPFSNNATICSYPSMEGGAMPAGLSPLEADTAFQAANAGRSTAIPTSVGFCMYIRRAALREVGLFDAEGFGHGYGEENDFCLRATARGWRHLLACDTFVFHEGSVSFGEESKTHSQHGMKLIERRYPEYRKTINNYVKLDAAAPFRFAATMALFRRSGRPTILMVSHGLGGGVRRHVMDLVEMLAGEANCLLLSATTRGATLSVPAMSGHPELELAEDRVADLVRVLGSAGISRVHIHHLVGMGLDVRALIHALDLPFDVTMHDYFALCPHVNLLPWPESHYCGEPGPAGCNACIASRPAHGARDITSWRQTFAWQFLEAERVICPTVDVRDRLARYGFAGRAIVAPHEPVAAAPWPVAAPPPLRRKLRIAVLGVLANSKGSLTVQALAEAADPATLEIHLIGYPEVPLPEEAAKRIRVTGEYKDADLPELLAEVKPHLVWFPAQWPETYSYTLSAAIDSGLPIVATRFGAFPERLAGRPHTWLVDPRASSDAWIKVFDEVRQSLRAPAKEQAPVIRDEAPDFYARTYLAPPAIHGAGNQIDLRRRGRTSVVVVPERLSNGALSPCAFIRLLLPLDHPEIGGGMDIVLASAEEALRYRADIVATQRHAVPDTAAADALAGHCRGNGMALLYDLDDDLLNIPASHPDAKELRPKAKVVQRMLRGATSVWVSTPALAASLRPVREDARIVPNGLDERLWRANDPHGRGCGTVRSGPLRVLIMGTATHDADFTMIMPALERVHDVFSQRVVIDMLGFSSRGDLPGWVNRLAMPVPATLSYPGFVSWITQESGWDIGLAPLADTPFNACKSAIKTLDYAALGLAMLASDTEVYRGSVADGPGGLLVRNDSGAWYRALLRLVQDHVLRRELAAGACAAFAGHTLTAQAAMRRAAWEALLQRPEAAPRAKRAGRREAA